MALEYKNCPDNYRVIKQRAAKIRNEARRPCVIRDEWRQDHPRPRKTKHPTPDTENDKQVTGNV